MVVPSLSSPSSLLARESARSAADVVGGGKSRAGSLGVTQARQSASSAAVRPVPSVSVPVAGSLRVPVSPSPSVSVSSSVSRSSVITVPLMPSCPSRPGGTRAVPSVSGHPGVSGGTREGAGAARVSLSSSPSSSLLASASPSVPSGPSVPFPAFSVDSRPPHLIIQQLRQQLADVQARLRLLEGGGDDSRCQSVCGPVVIMAPGPCSSPAARPASRKTSSGPCAAAAAISVVPVPFPACPAVSESATDSDVLPSSSSSVVVRDPGVMFVFAEQVDPQTRVLLNATRSQRPVSVKDMRLLEAQVIESISPPFDGSPSAAPAYYRQVCQRLGAYPFQYDECIRIMVSTMSEGPASWFQVVINEAELRAPDSSGSEGKMMFVLGQFKHMYLSGVHGLKYRKLLEELRLRPPLTERALTAYYDLFNQYHNATFVCGCPHSSDELMQLFVRNLPVPLATYIGGEYRRMHRVQEIYQLALSAVNTVDWSSSSLASLSSCVSSVSVSDDSCYGRTESTPSPPLSYDITSRPRPSAHCFFCGHAGHRIDKCRLFEHHILSDDELPHYSGGYRVYERVAHYLGWTESHSDYVQRMKRRFLRLNRPLHSQLPLPSPNPQPPSLSYSSRNDSMSASAPAAVDSSDDDDGDSDGGDESDGSDMDSRCLEFSISSSVCVPVRIDDIDVGAAVVDQGSHHSVIRATALAKYRLSVKLVVSQYKSARCISGRRIPILGCFVCRVSVGRRTFNDSVCVYVVDNRGDCDITCDFVLGRSAISTSWYPLVDTADSRLCTLTLSSFIQCHPAVRYRDDSRRWCVRRLNKSVGDHSVSRRRVLSSSLMLPPPSCDDSSSPSRGASSPLSPSLSGVPLAHSSESSSLSAVSSAIVSVSSSSSSISRSVPGSPALSTVRPLSSSSSRARSESPSPSSSSAVSSAATPLSSPLRSSPDRDITSPSVPAPSSSPRVPLAHLSVSSLPAVSSAEPSSSLLSRSSLDSSSGCGTVSPSLSSSSCSSPSQSSASSRPSYTRSVVDEDDEKESEGHALGRERGPVTKPPSRLLSSSFTSAQRQYVSSLPSGVVVHCL